MRRLECAWCRGEISATARRDSRFCSKRCRQASHRFGRSCRAATHTSEPIRLGYADPPYPGLAERYYVDHPDYAGEVDHQALIRRLVDGYDGWALSTSARALPAILALCVAADVEARVAAWFRGDRPGRARWPRNAWEPVVFAGGRRVPSREGPRDALVYHSRPRTTDPDRVIGAKPAEFAYWLFELLGALPGDSLDDLYPGSGGISRAWAVYSSRGSASDASRLAGVTRRV